MRTLIIAPDPEVASYLRHTLSGHPGLSIVGTLHGYPDGPELSALIHRSEAQALFACVDQPGAVPRLISQVETAAQPIYTVAVGRLRQPNVIRLMEGGVDEFLATPFQPDCLHACLDRLFQSSKDEVYA